MSWRAWSTTQLGRGQRLAGGDDKHSQPNAELAKGRQVRMQCAPVELTPWMDLERHRGTLALLNKNSRHGSRMCICTTSHNLLLSAALRRSDTPSSLDSEFRNSLDSEFRN